MRTAITLFLLLVLALPARTADREPDAWDRVLASAGLTRQTCRFDTLDLATFGKDEFVLPYFDAVHKAPLRAPFYARVFRDTVLPAAPSIGNLVMFGGAKIGEGTRLTLIGDPLKEIEQRAKAPNGLVLSIKALWSASGKSLPASQEPLLRESTTIVPKDVQQAAALLLYTEVEALKWRNKAFAAVPEADRQRLFDKLLGINPDDDQIIDDELYRLMHAVDMKYLLVGAEMLAIAADRVSATLAAHNGAEKFVLDADTPLGRVALHGAADDTYPDRAYALIIDTGGNDTYFGGGATYDAAHPVSVLIDVAGNDRYLENADLANTPVAAYAGRKKPGKHPTFGAGVLGYGILVDLAGDDLYRSLNNTQGRGLFGCGVLCDKAGNDRYDCYMMGQGSAKFGVGILSDHGGADEYRCFTTSQGMGDTKGFGLLIDTGGGQDLYEANDTVIDFPSAQTKDHNGSLSQGFGFGRRADFLDGHSLAGGIGALVDDGGKNTYTAGLFAQGAGYWEGLGLLSSGNGNDTYRGVWYVQAAAAHFAVGILHDTGGDDDYKATMNMAQGAGHDFSVGFLIDDAGNDRHEAPNLSLGGGNQNGFGFFWDKGGNDTYIVTPSTTLGRASVEDPNPNTTRAHCLTIGIFLDSGGTDTYPAGLPWAKNNAGWSMKDSGPGQLQVQRGAGLDVEAPGLAEPE